MSKSAHTIYLSVIGVLIAAIGWLVFAGPNRPQADPTSIAVLPFVALGAGESAKRVADSVTDKVVEALAQDPSVKVTSRTETEPLIESMRDITVIGKTLAVAKILEGSVTTHDNQIRVTAQLIDVASGAHLWSTTYDRDTEDLDAIVAHIATNVASVGYD
jgi:TolB-like protein